MWWILFLLFVVVNCCQICKHDEVSVCVKKPVCYNNTVTVPGATITNFVTSVITTCSLPSTSIVVSTTSSIGDGIFPFFFADGNSTVVNTTTISTSTNSSLEHSCT